jgi:DNA-binding NtrC family response regulator
LNQPGHAEKRRILIVDDEPGILNAVRRELLTRPLGNHRYEVELFSDPLQALERARVQPFEVAVSDYRMPEMSGLDFLKALAAIQHDCVRIVLSGQTDVDSLIQMISETHIYRFVPKPWNSLYFKSVIAQAIDFRDICLENRRLAAILGERAITLPAQVAGETGQILVVDDEGHVADAIIRTIGQHARLEDMFRAVHDDGEGYAPELAGGRIEVQVADSLAQALAMAERTPVACVIADFSAPGMEGGEFLTRLGELQPDCVTLMLSGSTQLESLVGALGGSRIHAFVAKPWADFELRVALVQALTRRRLMLDHRRLLALCKASDPVG